ncbi:MAG: hypothetical protein CVU46_11005 [Chloroflexi bacterium HGW-Chloroflexi-8]|nr:MAG: hypothetical protein CVU46_11005 [Chloroflexi bacterium HGW-Chloroflexi-8]
MAIKVNDQKLWERQPWESAADFRSFQYYLRQEPPRSIDEAYRIYRNEKGIIEETNKRAPGTWLNRAYNFTSASQKILDRPSWKDRAIAWDNHLADVANAAVERRWAKEAMGKIEVLGRLSEQGRVNISIFLTTKLIPYRTKEGELILDKDDNPMTYETMDINWENVNKYGHLVKSISSTQYGPKLELHDGQAALVHVGRNLKLFTDNVDVTSAGKKIQSSENLSDDQFRATLANAAKIGLAIAGRESISGTDTNSSGSDSEG